jgi:UPF0755 protein
MAKNKKKRKAIIAGILSLAGVLLIGAGIIGYEYYSKIYNVNIDLGSADETYLYIPTGSKFDDVVNILNKDKYLIDESSFIWLAEKKGYTTSVKPGRYRLTNKMTNNNLINMLRSGRQEPVKFTFVLCRTRTDIAGKAGHLFECDSTDISNALYNDSLLETRYKMNQYSIMSIFIPNTYEMYWNTSAVDFLDRMHKEYEKFWNAERTQKAEKMGLSKEEVVTLASIICQESNKKDEMPRLAGVYMNRLHKGMLLQACPTAIYAAQDFTITRVLKSHTEIESPYNTYIHQGLPPGPICTPSGAVIDKVLDYEHHDYLFFCAKDDFSGYHNFAKTNAQHEQNAARYHAAYIKLMQEKKKKQKN